MLTNRSLKQDSSYRWFVDYHQNLMLLRSILIKVCHHWRRLIACYSQNNTGKSQGKIKCTQYSLHLLQSIDHHKTLYQLNVVKLPPSTSTQTGVQADVVEVRMVEVVAYVLGGVEFKVSKTRIKEANGINRTGSLRHHGIHIHHNILPTVQSSLQITG